MFARRLSLIVGLALLVAAVAGGCGRKPRTYSVTGRVVLSDGTPVVGGTVSLEARDGMLSATAITNAQGEFALGTLKPGDGAPAGVYRAVVLPPVDLNAATPPPLPFHPKYCRYETSGLEFTIQEKANHLVIKLEPP